MRDAPAPPRLRLRARVALASAALGLVVTTCVALVALHFSDAYVHGLIDRMLRAEADYLRDRFAAEGRLPAPHLPHLKIYSDAPGDPAPPAAWGALAPGLHELPDGSGEAHLAIYVVGAHRLYATIDVAEEGAREKHLARDLLALVLLGTSLSAWLGWAWAGRAIEPVRRLAQQVESLGPPRRGARALAAGYADDEVGTLAQAFDRYQERQLAYLRRERAFTADASHELRTPLAVIRGAIEVMLDVGDCSAANATRLKRMLRGSDELRDLLDALLVIARSDEDESDSGRTADLDAVIVRLLDERADMFAEKRLSVHHRGVPGIAVAAPPRVIGVVVGNLLRAVTQFADGGELDVDVTPAQVSIALRRTAPQHEPTTPVPRTRGLDERADRVLGLGLIRRVCERRDWHLDEQTDDAGARGFLLRLPGPARA